MASVIFDTYAFIKQLKKSGFEEIQAEALAEAFTKAQGTYLEELVTRHDLKELELSTRHDLKELELSTRNDLKKLELSTRHDLKELELKIDNKFESIRGEIISLKGELSLVKWMIGVLLAGVVSLILKAFFIP